MARQHLGQHFLADSYWREQIAQAIRVWPLDEMPATEAVKQAEKAAYCWIEIGPGHGEMTEYLAGSGAAVLAIELDRNFSGHLHRLKKKFANLEVIHRDILESDLRAVAGGRRMRIYGSLPYYITSPILHHLFLFAELIDEIHVVVQTEVAERMAAKPGSKAYGYLSVATQLNARPEVVLDIPRAAFNPPPEVGSTLVTLRLPGERASLGLPASGEEEFLEFVKLCFSKKRKTLVNNLRESFSPESVREALGGVGLRPDARAEQISIEALARLFTGLRE
ncbi:MAG: 16S rRNA (adenine(1518)-N(6)/adenine(1519)-N(6))-dimethyltransferase RsmA [Acidobacteriota bacterium]|nr:16S rRNA (adenine(1518)-N(6)/adenine(1519)-N(6))-dimethyltransferase RsmA [Acidobacteriota bacterium]